VNELSKMKLLAIKEEGVEPLMERILAFLPARATLPSKVEKKDKRRRPVA